MAALWQNTNAGKWYESDLVVFSPQNLGRPERVRNVYEMEGILYALDVVLFCSRWVLSNEALHWMWCSFVSCWVLGNEALLFLLGVRQRSNALDVVLFFFLPLVGCYATKLFCSRWVLGNETMHWMWCSFCSCWVLGNEAMHWMWCSFFPSCLVLGNEALLFLLGVRQRSNALDVVLFFPHLGVRQRSSFVLVGC